MSQSAILLVESNILVRHKLAEYLRDCGYKVLEALDPNEALQILRDSARPIDVALVDIDTGSESGFGLATWIRRTLPAVEVLLAGTVPRMIEKAEELCRDGQIVSKPYEHHLVLEQIRRLIATRNETKRPNETKQP